LPFDIRLSQQMFSPRESSSLSNSSCTNVLLFLHRLSRVKYFLSFKAVPGPLRLRFSFGFPLNLYPPYFSETLSSERKPSKWLTLIGLHFRILDRPGTDGVMFFKLPLTTPGLSPPFFNVCFPPLRRISRSLRCDFTPFTRFNPFLFLGHLVPPDPTME